MSLQHRNAVAALHRMALPNGFLSSLGDRFLGILYSGIGRDPGSAVWVATDDNDQVLGFVSGTLDVRRCYRSVLVNSFIFLLWALIPALVHATSWKRILETLTYPFRQNPEPAAEDPVASDEEIPAELLSLAVSEHSRGLGVGRHLVTRLESSFRAQGYDGPYRVVTDALDPSSNAFYRKVGFALVREFLHHEHPMHQYVKVVGSSPAS